MTVPNVCVVIAAYNSAPFIDRAVRSSLDQAEVCEVIVVDDASADGTSEAAKAADDGSGRLNLLRFEQNRGPSAARNAAIEASSAPFIAMLDADDSLLPGRFANMVDGGAEWDLLADNIAFVPEPLAPGEHLQIASQARPVRRRLLSFPEFVARNISRPGRPRAELGFLKPLLRRAALERLKLRYDERLRLGEDFILYATALARGARFELLDRCGYLAIERSNSLSSDHRTSDLVALAVAESELLESAKDRLSHEAKRTLCEHLQSVEAKAHYRQFLDRKREQGLPAAGRFLFNGRRQAADVLKGLFRDKFTARPGATNGTRLLFDPLDFETGSTAAGS